MQWKKCVREQTVLLITSSLNSDKNVPSEERQTQSDTTKRFSMDASTCALEAGRRVLTVEKKRVSLETTCGA